jgi:flagellar basal-body rod protein FlgF
MTGGVWLGQTETALDEGPITHTGNELDVALEGPGFLLVAGAEGTLLTRDGRMLMDIDGRLRSVVDGAEMLGEGGAPIVLNPRNGLPAIDEDGFVRQQGIVLGRLAVVDVNDERQLQKRGTGRFAADGYTFGGVARVRAGFVEQSAVEPVRELASMIEASRAYQFNAQMITMQDQTAGRLISLAAA